ncbi:MAG: phage integrase N-terminal SAM-like domain-containing protein [Gemmataceae bacterium]|nr:phage integrase N-terminal SAM-like domain-containing protein [Gemmataceae bacterium]
MKLLDQCRHKLRLLHYALRTERSYLGWIERYVRFCRTPDGFRHPRDLGAKEVTPFLTHLATEGNVSASTQNQALGALLFLCRRRGGRSALSVLSRRPGAQWRRAWPRSRRPSP